MSHSYKYTVLGRNKRFKEEAINNVEKQCPSCNETYNIQNLDPYLFGEYKQNHYSCKECGTEWLGNCYDAWGNPANMYEVKLYLIKSNVLKFIKEKLKVIITIVILSSIIWTIIAFQIPSKIKNGLNGLAEQKVIKEESNYEIPPEVELEVFEGQYEDILALKVNSIEIYDLQRLQDTVAAYNNLSDKARGLSLEYRNHLEKLVYKMNLIISGDKTGELNETN